MSSVHFWRRVRGLNWRSYFTTGWSWSNRYWIMMDIPTRNKSYDRKNNCQIIMCRPTATTYWPTDMSRLSIKNLPDSLPFRVFCWHYCQLAADQGIPVAQLISSAENTNPESLQDGKDTSKHLIETMSSFQWAMDHRFSKV
jgi:hypothetical protein